MAEKIFNSLPIIGGVAGGGLGAWINTNHDMLIAAVISATIFAVVGGVVGYLIQLFMRWVTKKIKDCL